jgi:sterol desaturase/sphingolipid hydroxylase (fatty acid hydroxylase superfamily)
MPSTDSPFEFALMAWPAIWLGDLLRYLIPAAGVALLLLALPDRWRGPRRVRTRDPAAGQRVREGLHSMITVLVFSINGALIVAGVHAGVLRLYTGWSSRGTAYALLSLALLVLAHDTWFYWTHRALHRPALFRRLHRTHHRSVAPTPWAAYSFAVGEAVVQAVFLPLMLLVLPLHPAVILVFLTHMILRNVLGHAGVELMPRVWLAGWWGRWLTTTLHHDLHHAHGGHNFGLYFTWWDRIGGTQHPEYPQRLRQLVQRTG